MTHLRNAVEEMLAAGVKDGRRGFWSHAARVRAALDADQHLCGLPDIGSYKGQVILAAPDWLKERWPDGIGIDVCLALEIQSLWRDGIRTTGHCCGHGKAPAYIGVEPEFIPAMKAKGYIVRPNEMDQEREDSFVPKSIAAPPQPRVAA